MGFLFIYSTITRVKKQHRSLVYTHTLSDIGNLSNLIGSLSRTIFTSERVIMGELGAFPIFVSRKGSLKSPQNPRVDFF